MNTELYKRILARLEEFKDEYSWADEHGLHTDKWCAICEAIEVVKDEFERIEVEQ